MPEFKPIILCHAACSGGSLIFKVLCAQFSFLGLSEQSHIFPYGSNSFVPSDPELALLNSGVISQKAYGEIFFSRLLNVIRISANSGRQLLIREHSHSYFFQANNEVDTTDYPSWIAKQLFIHAGTNVKCVVTIRDPIDSWLGLKENFPRFSPASFDSYCQHYNSFISNVKSGVEGGFALLVKYEEFVTNPLAELQKIAEFLEIPKPETLVPTWQGVSSTGNSGRQSQVIELRKRRPFDRSLFRAAMKSKAYEMLIQELGYPHLKQSIHWETRLHMSFVSVKGHLAAWVTAIKRAIGRWAENLSFKSLGCPGAQIFKRKPK